MKETVQQIIETYLGLDDTKHLIRDLKEGGYSIIETATLKDIVTLLKKVEATKWA